jgi:acylphosphatase
MQRVHMIVHGKVQGVGFRWHTQQLAARYGIVGWVRNRSDGTVEIDAQGPTEAMNKFVQGVRKGSPFSKVTRISTQSKAPRKDLRSFQITY